MFRSMLFALVFFVSCANAMALDASLPVQKCMVGVVDVGSTGSRLHVYAYACNDENANHLKEVWSNKVSPGFATLESNQSVIDTYLKNLFAGAPANIPVYFYATAGMRLLSYDKQQAYYDVVQHWFKHTSWNLIEAKTITGREEGVFAWLAVNHEQKSLPGNKNLPEDIGVMDMGGASVQVVTSVTSADGKNPEDLIHIKLDNKDITLFVHSFLGLGATLVSQQFLNNASCFPEGYSLPDGSVGHGDAEQCSEAVNQLINHVHDVNTAIQQPLYFEPSKTWYVLGGLAYLLQEPLFRENEAPKTSAWLIQEANNTVCRRVWSDLKLEYPAYERLSQGCLMASYYHALLTKGYGLGPEELINLISDDAETDWTLGVVLHQH